MFTKKWALADVQWVKEGSRHINVFKITHPHRQQQLMIVPTPRFATSEFYETWVYQPYVKDHQLRIGDDIYGPLNVAIARTLMGKTFKRYPDYAYFRLVDLPDCIENGLTRRVFVAKENFFSTPLGIKFVTTPQWRDRHTAWVARRIIGLVGERYLSHPHESQRSYVLLLPPAQVPAAITALQSLGFEVSDRTSAEVGKEEVLTVLERSGWVGSMFFLCYLGFYFILFLCNETLRVKRAYLAYMDDLRALQQKKKEQEEADRREFQ